MVFQDDGSTEQGVYQPCSVHKSSVASAHVNIVHRNIIHNIGRYTILDRENNIHQIEKN